MSSLERTPYGFRTRLRCGKGQRQRFVIAVTDEVEAARRDAILQGLAAALVRSGKFEEAPILLRKAAGVSKRSDFEDVVRFGETLCGVNSVNLKASAVAFREIGEAWTSGQLHQRFPDHVRKKRTAEDDRLRLEKSVYPVVGEVPVCEFTLEHAERLMASLPPKLTPSSRRQYAQLVHRVLALAVYPLKHIAASPIPRGWLPRPNSRKAYAILLPAEDAKLLACQAIPLGYRLLYGFLHREGMRREEALSLTWDCVDLQHGTLRLDENKTDSPRWWKMSPGVAEALRAWKERFGDAARPDAAVFSEKPGMPVDRDNLAKLVRRHLKQAGVRRPELFERTAVRGAFGTHSFRRSFVTRALASGRTEDWVRQRTGHRSTELLRYRQDASSLAELDLGEVRELHHALPEFCQAVRGGPKGGPEPVRVVTGRGLLVPKKLIGISVVRERGLEPPRISTPEPKSGASANSATRAWRVDVYPSREAGARVVLGEFSGAGTEISAG